MIIDVPTGWLALGDPGPIGLVVDVAFRRCPRPERLQAGRAYLRQASLGLAGGDQDVMDRTEACGLFGV